MINGLIGVLDLFEFRFSPQISGWLNNCVYLFIHSFSQKKLFLAKDLVQGYLMDSVAGSCMVSIASEEV